MGRHHIQYLHRNQIDTAKWDQCIDNAANGLIYARTFYLDCLTDDWDALVLGDYEAVMPLPWRRKWGQRYVYVPGFLQRLGIYGKALPDEEVSFFYKMAAKEFSFIDLMTAIPHHETHWVVRERKNLVIPLNRTYAAIRSSYTSECIKNLRKSISRGCQYTTNVQIEQVIELYDKAYGQHATDKTYEKRLIKLAQTARSNGFLMLCGVEDATNGNLLQGAMFLHYKQRLYYVLGAPSAEGRKARATYYLIDQVLQQMAGTSQVFDFEGSDLPNVAAFYKQFGPQEEIYYHLLYNRLPWPLRLLKKQTRGQQPSL